MTNVATVYWSLSLDCPKCGEDIELSDQDDEHWIANNIFSNQWDKISGHEAHCPACKHKFTVDKVEY